MQSRTRFAGNRSLRPQPARAWSNVVYGFAVLLGTLLFVISGIYIVVIGLPPRKSLPYSEPSQGWRALQRAATGS